MAVAEHPLWPDSRRSVLSPLMRSPPFLAVFFVVAFAVALVAVRRGTRGPVGRSPGTVTLIGDSLNVGLEPYLGETLPQWRIVANDQVGRTTAEGIAELETGHPALSSYVIVSLGTNDRPDGVEAFERTSHACSSSPAPTAA